MSASDRIPKQIEEVLVTHRRGFLRNAGLLAVSLVYGGTGITEADAQSNAAAQGPGPYPDPDFRQIDSWIVIHENNTATFYVGKTDPGQGTGTGFRQLMSDELDIAFDRTTCIMGSTDITVDQVRVGRVDAPWRGIHGRCAASLRKRAVCCWKWHRPAWERRSINSPSATQSSP